MADDVRVRRTLLFMPGDDHKKIAKGAGLGIDSIIMDLEDGVALNRKAEARQIARGALTSGQIDFGRTERLIRLNPASSGFQGDDIRDTFGGRPDGYVLPKVESGAEIADLSLTLARMEQEAGRDAGAVKLLAIIETARGVVNLREIAASDPRLVALIFGAEDLAGSMGAIRTSDGAEVAYAKSAVVLYAAASNLQAIDTPYVALDDEPGLRAETQASRRMGYTGKLAIHPAQVGPIVEIFTPTDQEIALARQLIEAHDAHQTSGAGVFAFEGRMVDMPMIRAAERVLARARAAGYS